MTDLEAAWDEIHEVKPDRWHVGPPTYVEHRKVREHYAFDTQERPKAGHRFAEWTAVAGSEREIARCLRLIREARTPD